MNQDGDGGDPFELDPFGESEYDPSLAFAFVASQQAREHADRASSFVRKQLSDYPDRVNQYSRSARKSVEQQLQDIQVLAHDVSQAHELAARSTTGTREFEDACQFSVNSFHELRALYEQLMHTASQIGAPDPSFPTAAQPAINPQNLLDPRPASQKVHDDLDQWLSGRIGNDRGDLVVVKATPGVGKTHAMIQAAYREHQRRRRVIFSVRTKEMINSPTSELVQRFNKMSPTGKLQLAVIYGRDETNCFKHETVEAVMAHGYAPGPSVCSQCEYYPSNNQIYGLGICPYYQERIYADIAAKGARRNSFNKYPLVLTTHASPIAAFSIQGGRYGSFWSNDLLMFDEDPTDAMEVDTVLSEQQCSFRSISPNTVDAGVVATLFSQAITIGKQERKNAASEGFRAPGSREINSHPIHSKYDSSYTGQALVDLLDRSLQTLCLSSVIQASTLGATLRSVIDSSGFHVAPGALATVTDGSDINRLDVPPKSLSTIADAIHGEMSHALQLRRIVYQNNMGHPPRSTDPVELLRELEDHTDVEPMSYVTRLECLPADPEKGRTHDEWRFVTREFRPLANNTSTVVVGDAYAQHAHYEQLFNRKADMIDVVSELHPDARFIRVTDGGCGISELRRGGLQRLLAYIEPQLRELAKPTDRVLVYGHEELRPKVEQWLETVAHHTGVQWAYEHWWGGRGKDQYNGWEVTICLSDPVLSMSGIKHVANARAYRASVRARDPDEKLLHAQRCEITSSRRGAVHALRSSHPRISLEHDRMNVAELTQALHRSRPAHNAVTCIAYGEMEQSPDLIAQTELVVGPEDRRRKSPAPRKRTTQHVTTVDTFVTVDETLAAMLAILDHYGVYSSWFAHSLVVPVGEGGVLPEGGSNLTQTVPPGGTAVSTMYHGKSSFSEDIDCAVAIVDPTVFNRPPLKTVGSTTYQSRPHPNLVPPEGGSEQVPGDKPRKRPSARRGATEPAGAPRRPVERSVEPLPNPRTIIERVWHPPVYWQLLKSARALPKAVETAHSRLAVMAKTPGTGISAKPTSRWPAWAEGFMSGGRRPTLFWNSNLLQIDAALRVYYEIVENQYGPTAKGRLLRPRAVSRPPSSLSAVPF